MKKLFLVAALLGSLLPTFSQNIDPVNVKFSYTRMPLHLLPDGVETYYQDFNISSSYNDSRTEIENILRNAAVIPGIQRNEEYKGVKVKVNIDNYAMDDVKFEQYTVKEKRGDEQVSVKYYQYSFNWRYPIYYEVILPGEVDPSTSGFLLSSNEYKNYTKKTSHKSTSAARKEYYDNNANLYNKLKSELLAEATKTLKGKLSSDYGFTKMENQVLRLNKVKKFKKFDYSDINQASADIQVAFSLVKPDDMVFNVEASEKIDAVIESWKKTISEADFENKKSRINKKIAEKLYYNVAVCYAYLSRYDLANATIEEALKIDGKLSWDYTLKGQIADMEARFNANKNLIK